MRTTTTIYAKVLRVGGKTPKLTFETSAGRVTTRLANEELAKRLAQKLYERVQLRVRITYDPKTLETLGTEVLELREEWRDVHLADVVQSWGIELDHPS